MNLRRKKVKMLNVRERRVKEMGIQVCHGLVANSDFFPIGLGVHGSGSTLDDANDIEPSAFPNESSAAGCGPGDAYEITPFGPPKLSEAVDDPNPKSSADEPNAFGLWFVFPNGEPNVLDVVSPVHTLPSLVPKDSPVSGGCHVGNMDSATRDGVETSFSLG